MARIIRGAPRGRTTIPPAIRKRDRRGTRVRVDGLGQEKVMRPVPDLADLAGSLSKYATRKEANALLDEMDQDED